ncbi:hypothetical protein BC828DRAFT_281641 [Blastocladiella britannica]|nr:hypothetical protein BC828DRAFT_281641 [Blastocladiella britannica]
MSHAAHAQLIATLASLSSTLADFPPPTSSSNANSTTWPTNPAAVLAIDTDLGALVDLTATAGDAVLADALVGRGGAELVLKIVAEASVGDGAGEADALERIREMGMACLANLVRSPALAPTLVSSSLCAEVVAFMLVSEAEPRILLATIRFLQSAVTVVPPPQLVPLVSALLDAGDAGALAHLVFVLGATLHLPLFVATVNLFTALVWLVHRRLAIATPPGSSDPEFPVVGRATVEEGVRALVRAATADHEPGRGLDLDWAGAAAVTKCLGTLAMVGYGWRQIVGTFILWDAVADWELTVFKRCARRRPVPIVSRHLAQRRARPRPRAAGRVLGSVAVVAGSARVGAVRGRAFL